MVKNTRTLLVVPVSIVVFAALLSYLVHERFQQERLERFTEDAKSSLHLSTMRLDNHRDLLYAGQAFVVASDTVTRTSWNTFFRQQDAFARYHGVSSIAYVKNVATRDLSSFEARMKGKEHFGPGYRLREVSNRSEHGFVSVYTSNNDISAIEGMDLFRLDDRHDIYTRAAERRTVVASQPITLATGFKGFFSVLPVYKGEALDGYVLTSFRNDDLMKRLFSDTSFDYDIRDISGSGSSVTLYETARMPAENTYVGSIDVGGRIWRVEMSRATESRPLGYLLPAAILATGLTMAGAVYGFGRRSGVSSKV
jgi:hypothetical protein